MSTPTSQPVHSYVETMGETPLPCVSKLCNTLLAT